MLFKFIGAVITVATCSMFGFAVKYRHKYHIEELKNLNVCFSIIKEEIRFSMNDIATALKNSVAYASESNKILLTNFINMSKESDGTVLSELWTRALDNTKKELIYDRTDLAVINELGNLLGVGDIETQQNNIIKIENKINERVKLLNSKNEKMDITSKLGIYAGVILVILLI